jgi:Asp-tRNA(Asn)/Glu-tRNA(Gln) amidotransferase A subunit family amidase
MKHCGFPACAPRPMKGILGLMFVGRHFDEPTICRAAYAFEQSGDWKKT